MLTNRVSLLVSYAVVLTCGGAAPPPPASGGGPVIQGSVMGQEAPFPRIPAPDEFDTTREWSDMRRLIVGTCPGRCKPGPMAWIQPNRNAATWGQAQRDAGEVIARMISDSAYPKFNLQYRGKGQQDTVFWAVMKRGDSVVSVFHSTTRGTKDLIARTEVITHGPGFFKGLALARWVWSDQDDMAWGTCDGGACCKSPGR
jgi:hypothetical protein